MIQKMDTTPFAVGTESNKLIHSLAALSEHIIINPLAVLSGDIANSIALAVLSVHIYNINPLAVMSGGNTNAIALAVLSVHLKTLAPLSVTVMNYTSLADLSEHTMNRNPLTVSTALAVLSVHTYNNQKRRYTRRSVNNSNIYSYGVRGI